MPDGDVELECRKARDARLQRSFEVVVFLSLIIPPMLLAFFAYKEDSRISFAFLALSTILRNISLVLLVMYFLWRNTEALSDLGWRLDDFSKEFLIGIALFLPFTTGVAAMATALRAAGLSAPPSGVPVFFTAKGAHEYLLASIMVIIVAISEETIFRGYLLLRIRQISSSRAVPVAVSSLIFALGHGYEGAAGVVTVYFTGVALSLLYLWRGSLTAPIVIHFLQDFLGIIVGSLLRP